jgi:hypothetical protein
MDSQALVVTTVTGRDGCREQSEGMMNVCSRQTLVTVSPELQIPTCEFFGHKGIELKCRAQASSNLFEVFYLEYGGGGTIEFEYLDCRLEDVLS